MPAHHHRKHCRILFILKFRHQYGPYHHPGPPMEGFSSGLYNSAKFAADMLAAAGYTVKLVEVVDNNDIDREVSKFHPHVVIIEALWVVPAKFAVLHKLHPDVVWVVRVHSEGAFLAQEGIAVEWISEYPRYPKTYVAVNSEEALQEVSSFWPPKGNSLARLRYLPTYYPAPRKPLYPFKEFDSRTIHVCSMGAVRVLKNTLIQAIAAMRFAEHHDLELRFNVNATRQEAGGNAPYRNVVSLFKGTRHELIEHDWMSHELFLRFLKGMDLAMQVSLSETFSIVAADSVAAGVPTVGSPAIHWLDAKAKANPLSTPDLESKIMHVLHSRRLIKRNLANLRWDAAKSRWQWLLVIGEFCESCGCPGPGRP